MNFGMSDVPYEAMLRERGLERTSVQTVNRLRPWLYSRLRLRPVLFDQFTYSRTNWASSKEAAYNAILLLALDIGLRKKLSTLSEATKTFSEHKFNSLLKNALSPLVVKSSEWVGPYCLDFLISNAKGFLVDGEPKNHIYRGIAIEVDGNIHNAEIKMSKDFGKEEYLKKFRVLTLRISNDEIFCQRELMKICEAIQKSSSRVDFRSLRRMEKYFAAERLLAWTSEIELRGLLK